MPYLTTSMIRPLVKAVCDLAYVLKGNGKPSDDEPMDYEVIAELFYGLYGDEAIEKIEQVLEKSGAVEKAWNASDHPRGKNGRFIPKGSAEAVSSAQEAVRKVMKGDYSVKPQEIADHLSILTMKQIRALAAEHGRKVPKVLKADLIESVKALVGVAPTPNATHNESEASEGKTSVSDGGGKMEREHPIPEPSAEDVAEQINIANQMRRRSGKDPLSYQLKLVDVDSVTPSQTGEDYDNASSRDLAERTRGGKLSERRQDNYPIAVDENGKIIDGNHRHAAATINGKKKIWAIVPETKPEGEKMASGKAEGETPMPAKPEGEAVANNPKPAFSSLKEYNRRPIGSKHMGTPGKLIIHGRTREIKDQLKSRGWKYNPTNQTWEMQLVAAHADLIRRGGEDRIDFLKGLNAFKKGVAVTLNNADVFVDKEHSKAGEILKRIRGEGESSTGQKADSGDAIVKRKIRVASKINAPSPGRFLVDNNGDLHIITSVGSSRYDESTMQYTYEYETRKATPEESAKYAKDSKLAELKRELRAFEAAPSDERDMEMYEREAARIRQEIEQLKTS